MENFLFPRSPTTVRAKICGVTTAAQSRDIIALGVDALGFNFWPGSKRYLDPVGAGWLRDLAGQTLRIGVFVNAQKSTICDLLEKDLIDWAQLHGDEAPEFVDQLQQENRRVFKALGIKDRESLEKAARYSGPLLLDAYAPTVYGGSGATMDWALGAEAVRQFPDRDVILAGGLHPRNLAAAVRQVRPAAVDVASGVETSPGLKDLALCEAFIQIVKRS